MKIKIIVAKEESELPVMLRAAGIEPGDIIGNATPVPETNHDTVVFPVWSDEYERFIPCYAMSKNYKKI